MDNRLQLLLAQARSRELRSAAGAGRRSHGDELPAIPATIPVTLRFAFPDDERALARLATLDSREPPAMPVLLGEVGGQLLAALSLADGTAVADPFHPTVALVELLKARARQLTGPKRPRRPWRLWGVARLGSRWARS
jgi:hypothetical protein